MKVVQKYEKYVYVTHLLNPPPQDEDLLSLRSNFYSVITFINMC